MSPSSVSSMIPIIGGANSNASMSRSAPSSMRLDSSAAFEPSTRATGASDIRRESSGSLRGRQQASRLSGQHPSNHAENALYPTPVRQGHDDAGGAPGQQTGGGSSRERGDPDPRPVRGDDADRVQGGPARGAEP